MSFPPDPKAGSELSRHLFFRKEFQPLLTVEWPFAPALVGTVPFSSLRLLGQLLVTSILTFPIPWLQTSDGNLDESRNSFPSVFDVAVPLL